ncbi:zinc ABC transporter substrate-binding protein [Paracoccus stylophorae]|uniref:High-affinity zinc uptake system protein ZnuA n=1 Tax=Paracoccus stylophorae TaxID=659350 RepID=A0ABY7STX9_9RHOB|nr:zinc ABC transporter substrate-binding protein [Paracoccus stylophorae]WCR10346.1 zinc ABC transporter substrate-binding protein [Paracoccus stylophorae]
MRFLLSAALLAMLTGPAHAAPPQIVTDTAISGALVSQIMGDLGQPHVLLPTGSGVHHYQMRPSDARALQSAQLLVWFGPQLTPWLDRAAGGRDDQAGQLQLLSVPDATLRALNPADAHHHDHDHGDTDPHAWLDLSNAPVWLDHIARRLSELDPPNAAIYADNAAAAAREYRALDERIAATLAPLEDADFAVFHDAYGYFTDRYGLRPAIAVLPGDATSASAARVQAVRAQIAESGARCAFPEYGHDPVLIRTVTEGTDVTVGGELDPAGAGVPQGPSHYLDTMRGLADTLSGCLDKG